LFIVDFKWFVGRCPERLPRGSPKGSRRVSWPQPNLQ